jgi:hypothetical protein
LGEGLTSHHHGNQHMTECYTRSQFSTAFLDQIHDPKSTPKFYKYVKRWKGNRESIPANKGHNGKLIRDPIQKANPLNASYASLFSYKGNNPQIQSTE